MTTHTTNAECACGAVLTALNKSTTPGTCRKCARDFEAMLSLVACNNFPSKETRAVSTTTEKPNRSAEGMKL